MFASQKDIEGALKGVKDEIQRDLVFGVKGLISKISERNFKRAMD